VVALFGGLVEKFPLFHDLRLFPSGENLIHTRPWGKGTQEGETQARNRAEAMTKRKPGKFSVTKAVKANARERVGQPKPARVVESEPRTGREAKHKPKLEEVIREAE
jgi:hypothetical protein